MFCAICGTEMQGEFCPACGARAGQARGAASPFPQTAPATDIGLRAGAYLIDLLPLIPVVLLLGWIPIIGGMLLGLILSSYWLLRDIAGAGLGKTILGLRVVFKDGSPSAASSRILRNLPLAVGPALLIIPFFGYFLAPPVTVIVLVTEIVLLVTKNERLGDMLAGTTVLKKVA
jgi:uncharacterized RDD family membrane protein YckC